ncbi:uncharacterized protein LOC135081744 [Ostrinia nubilalis]|uniref:uncharacterized protein LOC135081744 n=1 Tax=Ostrinia nubilalis TaxID=29057 RepID=UPI0030826621
MSVTSEEYIRSILDVIASICNLESYEYSRESFKTIAQNYFGVLVPVSLTAKNDGKMVNINLVLKLAPTDERYRVSGAVGVMFSREMYVYSTLLAKYHRIQESFPLKDHYLMPTCYYICKEYCKEAIAMENMCSRGFTPYTQSPFLDYAHIAVSLKSLAKFHALSFILKENEPETFKEVEIVCVPFTQETNKRFMEIILDRLQKAIEKFNGTGYVEVLNELRSNCGMYVEAAASSIQKPCICHGDIWKENILFKYEGQKPTNACLIDYQTVRISSAAYDTLFLITTSTNSHLRKKHYYELLDLYYNTFDQILRDANLVPQQVYSRQMFDQDLKTVGPACFIIANTALWLSNGLQEVGHVRSKQVFESHEEKEEAVNRYRSIIQSIIEDYRSYGYLSL